MKCFKTLLILMLISANALKAQCVLTPLTLQERVQNASLIIEAQVQDQQAFWTNQQQMIMTAHTLKVSKVYKGAEWLTGNSIELVTAGGQIGDKAVKVEPELELEIGQIGIFMLIQKDGYWVAESGPQGCIQIDKHTGISSDVFNTYPAFSIAKTIQAITQIPVKEVNAELTKIVLSNKRAAPTITSINPSSLSAGTSSILTIKGSNFKASRDTSSVQFKNGDDGGASFIKALKWDYISWSDTMIKLQVRTKAGTGKIRVIIGGNGTANSTDTLKITYSHLNIVLGDSIAYQNQLTGMNSNNGITWKMNQRFYDSVGARGAFVRSLERWRCGSYINWDTLGHVTHSAIKLDGVNMCAWDTAGSMPSGVLAQCFSFWAGCYNPNLQWYVNELDIRFRLRPTSSTKWNYTTGNATSTQFHFESVATHELGHGHQMGHVINPVVVMHYSIANGQTKPNLSSNDIAGGNYVITKSANSVCGFNPHNKLSPNNCTIANPLSNFTINSPLLCKNATIAFNDSSLGNISAYAWNFGADATPSTANTKGPHNVVYSAGGNKTVSLTITTLLGNLNKTKTINIKNDSKIITDFNYTAAEKGKVSFTNTSNNPISEQWLFGDGDTAFTSNPSHQYAQGGSYQVKLSSSNSCNSKDTVKTIQLAYLNYGVNKNSACMLQALFFVDSSDQNVSAWNWTFTGGIPASAVGKGPHKVMYNSSGTKQAQLIITNTSGGNQSYTQTNLINIGTDTFTKAQFIYGYYGQNKVGFQNTSTGSQMQYKWYFGDGDSSSEQNPIHAYSNANNQVVKLKVVGNCGSHDTSITLRNFTEVQTNKMTICRLFPNPTNQQLYIQSILGSTEAFEVQVFDITGRKLFSTFMHSGEYLSTQSFASGQYLVNIRNAQNTQVEKIRIEHE